MHSQGRGAGWIAKQTKARRQAASLTGRHWATKAHQTGNGDRGDELRGEIACEKKKEAGEDNKTKNLKITHVESLHFKPIRESNKILKGHVPSTKTGLPWAQQRNSQTSLARKTKGDMRALPKELLDNGQGKCDEARATNRECRSNMEISRRARPRQH